MISAKEALLFRRNKFSLFFVATSTGIHISNGFTRTCALALTPSEPLLTATGFKKSGPRISAAGLSPVYLQGLVPRWVSCYAFFKGWLLLSQPPHCLWNKTLFGFTLNQHLWALIRVWVFPLSEHQLTRCPRLWSSLLCIDLEFDKKAKPLGPLLSNQYLYPMHSLEPSEPKSSFRRSLLLPG